MPRQNSLFCAKFLGSWPKLGSVEAFAMVTQKAPHVWGEALTWKSLEAGTGEEAEVTLCVIVWETKESSQNS